MKRPILCRLGLHRIDTTGYIQVKKRRHDYRGVHTWHRNYAVCTRCGRLVFIIKRMEARK